MILSIDGGTEETYSKFRRGGRFDVVMENLRQLVTTKKRLESYTPFLEWQFLVFEHNFHEIDFVKTLCQDLGVNQLNLAIPFRVDWDDPSIVVEKSFPGEHLTFYYSDEENKNHSNKPLGHLNQAIIRKRFNKRWGENGEQDKTVRMPADKKATCDYLYKSVVMDARGRVMPCCSPPSISQNIVFDQFEEGKDAFNSPLYQLSRLFFSNSKEYGSQITLLKEGTPYCSQCQQLPVKSVIETRHVFDYLNRIRTFDILSEKSKKILTDW
jgi:sulfatase maturation enzyme AslB (radical SAM superfamily)